MNNEDNDLNSISLGNMDTTGNNEIPIAPPVSELENNTDDLNAPEVLNEVPVFDNTNLNTSSYSNTVEPVAPLNYEEQLDTNDYNSNVFNDIGTVPPIMDTPIYSEPIKPEPKKKKGINKTLFVVIIILAMASVGAGVYIFLNMSNQKSLVTVKKVEIEAGSKPSSLITDYATFNGIDYHICSLNTTEIKDTNVVNETYPFTITCSGITYRGNAKIVDKTPPVVELKKATVALNGELKPSDFIASCKDTSECTYSFDDEEKTLENLKTAGNYDIPITIKDASGNETRETGKLTVGGNVANLYLVCSKINDNFTESNSFGINDNEFNKQDTRNYIFKLEDSEYNNLKKDNESKSEITYKGITGAPSFNDELKTLTIKKELNYEDLKNENNEEIPLGSAELKDYYENKGFSCGYAY